MSQQDQVETHTDTLRFDGIVVIEDYLDPETCDDIRTRIEEVLNDDDLTIVEGGEMSYHEFANMGEPVVNKRSGERDDGMLDVFNVDLVVREVAEFKNDEMIRQMVSGAAGEEYSPDNANVYVNKSVTDTRDFHADTYAGKFKSFVYLTDVPDESYGPFAYVRGSHDSSKVKQKISKVANKVRGNPNTDAVFYDESDVVRCTAPRGTLIVANQAGYHRGIPQKKGNERMLLTTSYTQSK
jgi:hypothetical protein